MSKPIYRPPQDESALVMWARGLAVLAVICLIIFLLFAGPVGCAGPGAAGFRQLKHEQRVERATLVRADEHARRIQRHTDRALSLTDDLARTHLDAAQVKLVEKFRLELNAVKLENTGLVKELAAARDIIVQRDATIAQTQAEVRESWWQKRVHDAKMIGLGFMLGLFLYGIIHTAWLGAMAYARANLPIAAIEEAAADVLHRKK